MTLRHIETFRRVSGTVRQQGPQSLELPWTRCGQLLVEQLMVELKHMRERPWDLAKKEMLCLSQ